MSPAKKSVANTDPKLTANNFIIRVYELQDDQELKKILKYFKTGKGESSEGDQFIGVRMGSLFALAKEFVDMPIAELEKLLKSPIHEIRAGACSIMDKAGRQNKLPEEKRKALYDLYLKKHDRINNWDLVDLAAQYVIGRYLFEKPKTILTKLAKSKNLWERRTAIVSTSYFIRQGDIEETFRIANILVHDKEDLVQKAVGGWIREAGKQNQKRLIEFLDTHAAKMPRTMLRYAIEKLPAAKRQYYLKNA